MSADSKSIEELYDLAIAEHYDRDRFKYFSPEEITSFCHTLLV